MERLEQQLKFILELDKQKEIVRQTYLADASRKEGDAEHAWHLAVMVFLLADYANEKIDVLKTIKMVLLHDVQGGKTKRLREERAADRIYGMLPEDQKQEYRALWEEFEKRETPEAKFANTLDKVQPVLLNNASGGKSWREHGIKKEQVLGRNQTTHEGSEALWEYIRNIIEENTQKGNILE